MPNEIISTKFIPPPLSKTHVPRHHLLKRINVNECKLILISAPAGFGKTTLLSDWASKNQDKAVWLSIDKTDNDLVHFWTYIVTALQARGKITNKRLEPILHTPQHFSINIFLAGLIDEISYSNEPITLILDDYHFIESKAVHESMYSFISYSPRNCRTVISTRSDPPFALGRMRSNVALFELRINDIRFNHKETSQLLEQELKIEMTDNEISILNHKIEGWSAGLHLAALSLKNYQLKSDFFSNFSGEDRFIMDYLVEEVLSHQPQEIRKFLLYTSILEKLSGPVCNALMEVNNSQKILDYLDENNLFLILLDNNRQWYRYHHLFEDLLRKQLTLEFPQDLSKLHERASNWYSENGYVIEAINHAFQAHDYDSAAQLAESTILDLISQAKFGTIQKWMENFPQGYLHRFPWLGIANLWLKTFSGDLGNIIIEIENLAANLQTKAQDYDHILGHIFSIKACLHSINGEQEKLIKTSQQALALLQENDYFARGMVALILGLGLRWKGDFDGAIEAYSEAQIVSRKSEDCFVYVYSSCFKGYALVLQGKLKEGYDEYQSVLKLYNYTRDQDRWTPPVLGINLSFLSGVFLRWNRVEEALKYAEVGLQLSQSWGNKQAIQDSYFFYIQALIATDDIAAAKIAIQEARENAKGLSPFQQLDVFYQEANLYFALGNLEQVTHLINDIGINPYDEVGYLDLQTYQILLKSLRLKRDWAASKQLSSRLLNISIEVGIKSKEMEIRIEQALLHWEIGDKSQAGEEIEKALAISEQENQIFAFLNEGQSLINLLKFLGTAGKYFEYVEKIISAYHSKTREKTKYKEISYPSLTKREKEVLMLLILGQTSNELAKELCISVGTARTHIKNIYQKLSVHNRVEVVNRAKELALV